MKISRVFASGLGVLLVASTAHAVVPFIPTDISGLTDGATEALLKTAAIGGDYRAYMPARPLGLRVGLDIGVDVAAISPPQEFNDAFFLVTGQAIPAVLPLPRISIHKGLPYGIDLGFSFLTYTDPQYSVSLYGGEIKYAVIRGGVTAPAVAVKASASYNTLGFLNTHTYKLDAIASKNLYVLEPYLGLGIERWSGDLNFPVSLGPLPVNVSDNASGTHPHFYAGAVLKLFFFKVTGEVDYSTAGVTTYGGKVSLGF